MRLKVLLANPRGFCAGVNMAIESLNKALEIFGTPIYVFHEIVHNRSVVENFSKRGAVFVEKLEECPKGATLLYSAHGVSPEIKTKALANQIRAIDATCPLVTKVHLEVLKFAKQGFRILYIGHEGHDEVIGTMGEAPECIDLIESIEDVEKLSHASDTKLAYLTQTTLSVDDTRIIIDAIKKKYPQIVGPPREDICYATQNRQEAVKILTDEADVVIVVGSQNSSNSLRLAELGNQRGKPSYLVDSARELFYDWFKPGQTVLLTAGASAPEKLVQECVDYFKENFKAEIENRVIKEEKVLFGLPKELRVAAS
jgi:4-hydroxy-3-methylbut-2-enyl diphosphate reductase